MASESDWFPPTMHMDLVCGQILDRNEALGPVLHEGEQYFFCSSRCQSHFLRSEASSSHEATKAVILPFPVARRLEPVADAGMGAQAFS